MRKIIARCIRSLGILASALLLRVEPSSLATINNALSCLLFWCAIAELFLALADLRDLIE